MVLQARVNVRHPKLLKLYPRPDATTGEASPRRLANNGAAFNGRCLLNEPMAADNLHGTEHAGPVSTAMPTETIAAVTGTKSFFRRKNVVTLDLCDAALKDGLLQFFELYAGFRGDRFVASRLRALRPDLVMT